MMQGFPEWENLAALSKIESSQKKKNMAFEKLLSYVPCLLVVRREFMMMKAPEGMPGPASCFVPGKQSQREAHCVYPGGLGTI